MGVRKILVLSAVLYLGACAGGSAIDAAKNPVGYAFPNSVMADRLSFSVSPNVAQKSFMLSMKFALNAAGEQQQPETPPTDEQWKKAAEAALPPGCKIEEITPSPGGEAQVKFSC